MAHCQVMAVSTNNIMMPMAICIVAIGLSTVPHYIGSFYACSICMAAGRYIVVTGATPVFLAIL